MVKNKINKALEKLRKEIEEELIVKIEKLNISNKDIIIEALQYKDEKPKRKSPVIPKEKRCNKLTKSNKECPAPSCFKGTCWAHLDKENREKYQKLKKSI